MEYGTTDVETKEGKPALKDGHGPAYTRTYKALLSLFHEDADFYKGKRQHIIKVMQASLKEIRMNLGISEADFSNFAGIARETLSDWEQGRTEMSDSQYIAVCGLFDQAVKEADHGLERLKKEILPILCSHDSNQPAWFSYLEDQSFLTDWFLCFPNDRNLVTKVLCDWGSEALYKAYVTDRYQAFISTLKEENIKSLLGYNHNDAAETKKFILENLGLYPDNLTIKNQYDRAVTKGHLIFLDEAVLSKPYLFMSAYDEASGAMEKSPILKAMEDQKNKFIVPDIVLNQLARPLASRSAGEMYTRLEKIKETGKENEPALWHAVVNMQNLQNDLACHTLKYAQEILSEPSKRAFHAMREKAEAKQGDFLETFGAAFDSFFTEENKDMAQREEELLESVDNVSREYDHQEIPIAFAAVLAKNRIEERRTAHSPATGKAGDRRINLADIEAERAASAARTFADPLGIFDLEQDLLHRTPEASVTDICKELFTRIRQRSRIAFITTDEARAKEIFALNEQEGFPIMVYMYKEMWRKEPDDTGNHWEKAVRLEGWVSLHKADPK